MALHLGSCWPPWLLLSLWQGQHAEILTRQSQPSQRAPFLAWSQWWERANHRAPHLNLLIGDVIIHHRGGLWLVILRGAGPPAGRRMESSFPGHPCQPISEPSEGFLFCSPSFIHEHSTLPCVSLKYFISVDKRPSTFHPA